MNKPIIFLQGGGGEEDYQADAKLVASLQKELGPGYVLSYPLLRNEEAPDLGRIKQISKEFSSDEKEVVVVAHSLGASMFLKYLSENKVKRKIMGIFLIATPFWSGDEEWAQAYKLQPDFASRIDKKIPMFFYHCRDDEVAPVSHLAIYRQEVPWASFREIPSGGHQLNNDLAIVANDIKSL